MSWSKAALVAIFLAPGLAACGFQPMYAKTQDRQAGPVMRELSGIRVMGIEDRNGQMLRNALVQGLTPAGEPGAAQYVLMVKINESLQGLAEQKDGKTSLGNLILTATFQLSEYGGEQRPLFSNTARSIVSYRFLGPRYGTVAAERDAQDRAIADVAQNIKAQLATFFAGGKHLNTQAGQ